MTSRERAAWHEAGHVAVALVLGCKILRVHLDEEGTGLTHVLVPPGTPAQKRRSAVMRSLAGPAAEALALGLRHLGAAGAEARLVEASAVDFRDATAAVAVPGTSRDRTPEVEWYWGRTVALLEARWDAVERVASALVAAGRLGGTDAAAVASPRLRRRSGDPRGTG